MFRRSIFHCSVFSSALLLRIHIYELNHVDQQEKPYVMVREDKNLTGNARFEGFCIDLLKWIAGQVGFQYAIRLVPDHMYGVYDPETKEWNGIVRELMEKVTYNSYSTYNEKAFLKILKILNKK